MILRPANGRGIFRVTSSLLFITEDNTYVSTVELGLVGVDYVTASS